MDNYYFKHLNTLELSKVLNMLSGFCGCADSAVRAAALLPEGSFEFSSEHPAANGNTKEATINKPINFLHISFSLFTIDFFRNLSLSRLRRVFFRRSAFFEKEQKRNRQK